jgi:hypothetical protein
MTLVLKRQQGCADGDAIDSRACFANVRKGDDSGIPRSKKEVCASFVGLLFLPWFSSVTLRLCGEGPARQISNITGMISGRFCVCLEIKRFKSARIFSLITP